MILQGRKFERRTGLNFATIHTRFPLQDTVAGQETTKGVVDKVTSKLVRITSTLVHSHPHLVHVASAPPRLDAEKRESLVGKITCHSRVN